MSEFDNYSPSYQPIVSSDSLTRTAPQEDGPIQKVIRGVRSLNIPDTTPTFRLHEKPTGKYEGLRDAELFLLKDLANLDKKSYDQLAEDMNLDKTEIFVIARRSGFQHLAKVDQKVLARLTPNPDTLAKGNGKEEDALGVRAKFDEVFKKG